MKCPRCGEENREVAHFCQHCGEPLPAETPTAVGPAEMPNVEPSVVRVIAETAPEEPVSPPVEQKVGAAEHDDETVIAYIDNEPADEATEPEACALPEPGTEVVKPQECELIAAEEMSTIAETPSPVPEPEMSAPPEPEDEEMPFEMTEALEEIPDESDMEADDLFFREPAERMAVFQAGTVINGRYLIGEVLSSGRDEVLYRVRDLRRCRQCGYDQNEPEQAFCEACGAVLEQKPLALMLTRPIELQDAPVEAQVEQRFTEGDFAFWVWRETVKSGSSAGAPERMRLVVGHKSDVGRQRDLDEDAMFVLVMEGTYESVSQQVGLFVVADGMGGHEGGEVASKLAIHTFAGELLNRVFSFELVGYALSAPEVQKAMVAAVQEANEEVYLERQKRQTDMGTTFTAVLLKDWTAYVAHVGDCRAFRWSSDGLEQLTTDHSIIASMVAAGTATPEEIYTHPRRNVIYRSVGDQPTVEVDVSSHKFAPGDRLVICCDGLWEMIRNEGIADVLMRQSDPQLACEEMVELANTAGGDDNISVIVVQL